MRLKQKTAGLFGIILLILFGCSNQKEAEPKTEAITENTEKNITYETNAAEVLSSSSETSETSALHESKPLTLDQVLTLSKKKNLTWSDFEPYTCTDIGSGLYILKYDIDSEFYLLVGGTGRDDPMYIRLVSAENKKEDTPVWIDLDAEDVQTEDIKRFIQDNKKTETLIGITAHIKELNENSLDENAVLIHSDTDDFPGLFLVDGMDEMTENEELKGGTSIYIVMQEVNKTESQTSIPLYHAKKMMILHEEEQTEQKDKDIVLTEVPKFFLTDPLSSQYSNFSLSSGNYCWTVEENGTAKTTEACGPAPLESLEHVQKLKLPHYNTEQNLYMYHTKILPDILTVRQWDCADIGNTQAREESIATYYDKYPFLELQRGKVYEFTAEWKKEHKEKNQFYATARYVLVTE